MEEEILFAVINQTSNSCTIFVWVLAQLFPKAQFIYMHRHPIDVFVSAANMADTTYWYSYLNTPTDDEVLDFIISQYSIMMRHYLRDRSLIPDGNLIEVGFDEVTKDPMVGIIYQNRCILRCNDMSIKSSSYV